MGAKRAILTLDEQLSLFLTVKLITTPLGLLMLLYIILLVENICSGIILRYVLFPLGLTESRRLATSFGCLVWIIGASCIFCLFICS